MPEIVFQNNPASSDQSEIENLQTTLASLNQRILILQEALQEKDQEISDLKKRLEGVAYQTTSGEAKIDDTLTLVGALIKLYKYLFPPGKALS